MPADLVAAHVAVGLTRAGGFRGREAPSRDFSRRAPSAADAGWRVIHSLAVIQARLRVPAPGRPAARALPEPRTLRPGRHRRGPAPLAVSPHRLGATGRTRRAARGAAPPPRPAGMR